MQRLRLLLQEGRQEVPSNHRGAGIAGPAGRPGHNHPARQEEEEEFGRRSEALVGDGRRFREAVDGLLGLEW